MFYICIVILVFYLPDFSFSIVYIYCVLILVFY